MRTDFFGVGVHSALLLPGSFIHRVFFCCILAQLVYPQIIYFSRADTRHISYALHIVSPNSQHKIHILLRIVRPTLAHIFLFISFLLHRHFGFFSPTVASHHLAKFSVKGFFTNARVLRKNITRVSWGERERALHIFFSSSLDRRKDTDDSVSYLKSQLRTDTIILQIHDSLNLMVLLPEFRCKRFVLYSHRPGVWCWYVFAKLCVCFFRSVCPLTLKNRL